MSEDLDSPSSEYKSLSWSEVWIDSLTKPSVETYERLVRDPGASPNKAYIWVFICALIGFTVSAIIGLAIGSLFEISSGTSFSPGVFFGSSLIQLVCIGPVIAVLSVIGLMFNAGLTQLVARALGGSGTYSELVYAMGAYVAPLSLLSYIIGAIPFVGLCLGIPLAIYYIVLGVVATNAVNSFGWGKAVFSSLIVPVIIIVLVACGVIATLVLLGPAIGDVFSEIVRELSTPTAG